MHEDAEYARRVSKWVRELAEVSELYGGRPFLGAQIAPDSRILAAIDEGITPKEFLRSDFDDDPDDLPSDLVSGAFDEPWDDYDDLDFALSPMELS